MPFSFIGGALTVTDNSYKYLLAAALVLSAARLAIGQRTSTVESPRTPASFAVAGIGSSIGFLSGIVGVGGGIFLSPIAIFLHWTTVKSAATLSALFILVNSLSGIVGRAMTHKLIVTPALGLIIAAFSGGLIGSYFGSKHFDGTFLKRILSLVLLIAAFKLIWASLGL